MIEKNRFSYGQSFYKTISRDLRKELPDVKSFSETNLRYMQKFAEIYSEFSNLPQVGEDFRSEKNEPLFAIPWGHHKIIMDKCSGNPQKALFFVNQVIQNGWSRAVLLNFLDTDLFERQGKAITNFKWKFVNHDQLFLFSVWQIEDRAKCFLPIGKLGDISLCRNILSQNLL